MVTNVNRTHRIIAIVVFVLILAGQAYLSIKNEDILRNQWEPYDFNKLPTDIYP